MAEYFAYVLRSLRDSQLYTGHTEDLEKRLLAHNSGKVKSTRSRKPFELIYHESCTSRAQARWRERQLKNAWNKKQLKKKLDL